MIGIKINGSSVWSDEFNFKFKIYWSLLGRYRCGIEGFFVVRFDILLVLWDILLMTLKQLFAVVAVL